jgi:hypothetical protein
LDIQDNITGLYSHDHFGLDRTGLIAVLPMIISIDFDGVIADTSLLKKEYALTKFGLKVPKYACDKTSFSRSFGEEKYEQMTKELYTQTVTRITPPIHGAINAVKVLSKNHKLVLLSDRPNQRLKWAKEWLRSRGLMSCFFKIISSHGLSKHKSCLASRCRVVIDDDIRHLSKTQTSYKKILLKSGGTSENAVYEGMLVAKSWKEILVIIKKLRFKKE